MKRLTFKGWVHRKLGEIRRAHWIQATPTGQEPPPPPHLIVNKRLQTRLQHVQRRTARAIWLPLFHFTAPPPPDVNINVIQFRSRHRFVYARPGRLAVMFFNDFQHFETPPGPPVTRDWVGCKLLSATARGGC